MTRLRADWLEAVEATGVEATGVASTVAVPTVVAVGSDTTEAGVADRGRAVADAITGVAVAASVVAAAEAARAVIGAELTSSAGARGRLMTTRTAAAITSTAPPRMYNRRRGAFISVSF